MYNHEPPEYLCPFCLLVQGREGMESPLKRTDIIFQTEEIMAFMATRKHPNNPGHVLIIPNLHFENLYDLPLALLTKIHSLSRDVSLAMKATYQCDGILLRQHNEPAGDQHIWHYHLHVIPRYQNDDFHNAQKIPFEAGERAEYAEKLKDRLTRSENRNTYDS